MKKMLLAVVALLVLAIAGVLYLVSNLDNLFRQAVEIAGSNALGTQVRVESASINLGGGSATLTGLTVANPEGFSDQAMLRFDELQLVIDVNSLEAEPLRIVSVRSVNPYVLYEMQGTRSNLDALRQQLSAQEPATDQSAARQPVIAIDDIRISGIQGALRSDLLPMGVNVTLGDIDIASVQGTPEQLAQQIAASLLTQLATRASAQIQNQVQSQIESQMRSRLGL